MKNLIIFFFSILLLTMCQKTPDLTPAVIPVIKSNEKIIISYGFLKINNPSLSEDIIGIIKGSAITLDLPADIQAKDFIATFSISSKAKIQVASTEQLTSQTTNSFDKVITYTVTAEDQTTASYTVQINKVGISPLSNINLSTSYYIYSQKENFLYTNLGSIFESVHGGYFVDEFAARSFYDFDKDGDLDLIGASFNYESNTGFPIHYYKNNNGSFKRDNSVFDGTIPTYVHARQSILGDFDKNGWMDVVIIGHGYDQSPFPGEKQRILFNFNGKFTAKELPLPSSSRLPFTHSGCSGDIDNDGDIDLFFTSTMVSMGGIFLKNDGAGNFTYDASIFPSELTGKNYYSSVLYDLNTDGYLDLVITGHDKDQNTALYPNIAAMPMILWGNFSGKYNTSNSTLMPVIQNYGVSNNINILDYNKDGKSDLLITKTGDGSAGLPFYQGYYVQLLKNNDKKSFEDVSATAVGKFRNDNIPKWIIWLRPQDIDNDGDLDFTSEDKFDSHVWINNGSVFTKN